MRNRFIRLSLSLGVSLFAHDLRASGSEQVTLEVTLEKDTIYPGDDLKSEVHVKNIGKFPANVQFRAWAVQRNGRIVHIWQPLDVTVGPNSEVDFPEIFSLPKNIPIGPYLLKTGLVDQLRSELYAEVQKSFWVDEKKVFFDDFNRANNVRLEGDWKIGYGKGFFSLDRGSLVPLINDFIFQSFTPLQAADSDTSITVSGLSIYGFAGVMTRFAEAPNHAYGFGCSSKHCHLSFWYFNGFQPLASKELTTPLQDGAILTLEVHGNVLKGKVNGVDVLTATDSRIASGRAGIFVSGNCEKCKVDWFEVALP